MTESARARGVTNQFVSFCNIIRLAELEGLQGSDDQAHVLQIHSAVTEKSKYMARNDLNTQITVLNVINVTGKM